MDDDPVQLRLLNDFLYCPRRCYLHRVEGLWEDNVHTIEGTQGHEICDDPGYRQTVDALGTILRIERALPLFSHRLNLIGKGDIVEFHRNPSGGPAVPKPVDYKRGPKRKWENDDVQLCAQGICLEEMFGVAVPAGAVYHVTSKRRREVPFTSELRLLTLRTIEDVRDIIAGGTIPQPELRPQCDGCSMRKHCLPELTNVTRKLDKAHAALFCRDTFVPPDISSLLE